MNASSKVNRRHFIQAGAGLIAVKPASLLLAAGAGAQRIETPYGNLALQDLALSPDDLVIHGNVTNHTDRPWRWISLLLHMRDAQGNRIAHDDRFDGYFYIKEIGRNETKGFVDRKGNPARLLLRPSQA